MAGNELDRLRNLARLRSVIVRPVISEKSYAAMDDNVYTFVVSRDANKIEIKQAVETIFEVRVASVKTLNRKGKRRRNRRTGGMSTLASQKRAIVTLAPGQKIDILGG
ncbi:MAG: 50S ribosomal protein L23 [Acidimicrobiia bacterium]